jgi:hypothetical protein
MGCSDWGDRAKSEATPRPALPDFARIKRILEWIGLVGDLIIIAVTFTTDYVPKFINAIGGPYSQLIYFLVVVVLLSGFALIPFSLGRQYREPNMQTIRFNHTRKDVSDSELGKMFSSAKKEVVLFGVSLAYIAKNCESEVIKTAERGIVVRLILPDPDPKLPFIKSLAWTQNLSGLEAEINLSLDKFVGWKVILAEDKRKYLDIRTYSFIPLYGITAADGDEPEGWIRIEPFLYGGEPQKDRPSFEVRRSDSKDEFDKYWHGCKISVATSDKWPKGSSS